jgi:hypothetical protein
MTKVTEPGVGDASPTGARKRTLRTAAAIVPELRPGPSPPITRKSFSRQEVAFSLGS